MAQMTGGQALVEGLRRQGIEVVFGLPGVQLDWAFDALYEAQDHIHVYHTRHEQATSYMADGYARSTGKIGVCLVVPGPGLLNAGAGLSTAYACSSPVLCIAGQIQSDLIDKGRGLLHEIPNQLGMALSFSKWSGRAMTPAEVPGLVAAAFQQLQSGRPRPVTIEIPPDVLMGTADVSFNGAQDDGRPSGDPDLLESAAKTLGAAKRPIIFVGGGINQSEANEALLQLAEILQAPVVMSSSGKGAIDSRHYLAQNLIGARDLLPQADVVLVAGTRFTQPATSDWGPKAGQTVIQMDIDPEEIGRNHPVAIGIQADLKRGLTELANRVPKHNSKRESREAELTATRERVDDILFEVQPQASFAGVIREVLPEDGILVNESTQVGYWSAQNFPVYKPRTFLTSGFQGTLGYGFATALGAQVGNPDKKVISVNGDGGFMYNVQELSTAARHNINLITIVFNDNAYGNVRRIQKETFNGRTIASDLKNPDFVKLAESFGVEGRRASGPEGLRTVLEEVITQDNPVLIEVPVSEMPSIWPIIFAGRRM